MSVLPTNDQKVTDAWLEALMSAWVVIANVSEGDWTKQTEEWQEAAKRWRDEVWHPALSRSWGGSDG